MRGYRKRRENYWANYNGPGQGITVKQIHELLGQWGIEPVQFENGEWGYKREQFEKLWELMAKGAFR